MITTEWREGEATLVVHGDIDIAAKGPVGSAIEAAVGTAGATDVVIDLSDVPFLDSSGINVLVQGRRLADEHQVTYRVVGSTGIVRKVLELTGVWDHLTGENAQQ
jgi:anti-sigma B factor antagonist